MNKSSSSITTPSRFSKRNSKQTIVNKLFRKKNRKVKIGLNHNHRVSKLGKLNDINKSKFASEGNLPKKKFKKKLKKFKGEELTHAGISSDSILETINNMENQGGKSGQLKDKLFDLKKQTQQFNKQDQALTLQLNSSLGFIKGKLNSNLRKRNITTDNKTKSGNFEKCRLQQKQSSLTENIF